MSLLYVDLGLKHKKNAPEPIAGPIIKVGDMKKN